MENMTTNIPVYSVVAYSGTGKTTFLEKLIPQLKQKGLRVAVLKHDAHEFEIDKEGKDSYRMTQAGADMTMLTSASKAVIMENRPTDPQTILSTVHDVDIILTEGYKFGDWDKILIVREATGKGPALDPDTCFAVVSDMPVETIRPCFDLNDASKVADLLVRDMQEKKS